MMVVTRLLFHLFALQMTQSKTGPVPTFHALFKKSSPNACLTNSVSATSLFYVKYEMMMIIIVSKNRPREDL